MSIRGAFETTAGANATVSVTARDKYGNYVKTGGERFVLFLTDGTNDMSVPARDNQNGNYVIAYAQTVAGPPLAILHHLAACVFPVVTWPHSGEHKCVLRAMDNPRVALTPSGASKR